MHAAVAILLPILLTSQVFCQTRDRNDKIDAYNDINDIIYESSGEDYIESSGEDYVESSGEDYGEEINPEDDYNIISDKVIYRTRAIITCGLYIFYHIFILKSG